MTPDGPGPATLTCPVCAAAAPAGALFCPRCTSPLSVVSLSALTDADRARCMAALFEVLGESAGAGGKTPADVELFRAYLSATWLRPETALIQYAEARGLAVLRAAGHLPPGPHLDLGCGDGVHAALYSGWRFAPDFDCFQSLDLAKRDLFDHFDPAAFRADVLTRGRTIDVGLDIKPTALARSRALGVFARVDAADAARLPLPDASVAVVFSNMIRDLGDTLPAALAEVRRVLVPGGVLVASAMTPAYRSNLYFAPRAEAADRAGHRADAEALLRLDRGRSVFCRQQLSRDQWAARLTAAGLRLQHTLPIVGAEAIRFWDVGLRPFSIPLISQAQAWRDQGLLPAIKPGLLTALESALAGLRDRVADGETCMHLLVATPGGSL